LIALHEIGHTMGLDHTTSVASIMGGGTYTTTNGSLVYPGLGEDASTALYDMYGANSGNIEDLAVNHWRHTGSSGGYATHGRTRLFTTGGSVVASTWVDDEPIYDVQPGSTYKVEFSFENNGENAQYIDAGFYISTNAFISTSDRLIRTKPMVLVRNASPSLRQSTITIPSDLTVNEDYYLGVRIDDGNILSEESETNNATYVGIRTY
jgi:Matrixin./CARDB.